jgi:predicted nucleic acid-binding protein
VTLVDTNVFMYAGGRAHPNKSSSKAFLRQVVNGSVSAAIDAEVLQEILHRYRAVNRWEDGKKAYDLTRGIMRNVVSITADVVDDARLLMDLICIRISPPGTHSTFPPALRLGPTRFVVSIRTSTGSPV